MIAGPAWTLEGRAFTAAAGAARATAEFVARSVWPPPDNRDGASQRCAMLATLTP